MPETIPVAYVHGYNSELYRLTAAGQSTKFRGAVRVKTGLVGKTHHFDRLGSSDLTTVTSLHQPTPILNPQHSRRRVTFTDKAGAILLDKFAPLRMLIEPGNDYARNHAEAVNRFFDTITIDALTGSSVSVDDADATSNVTLPAGQQIAAGGAGLTFEKVNQTVRILNENNVPQEGRYFAVSPQGIEDLLAEVEVTSSDFSNLQAIQNGGFEGRTWMGFTWIMSTLLGLSGTTRTCIAWQRDAIVLAIAKDIELRMGEREDLNYAKQVYACVSAGAVRLEEERVVQVDIVES